MRVLSLILMVMAGPGISLADIVAAQAGEGPPERLLELLEEARLDLERDWSKCPYLIFRVSPDYPPHGTSGSSTGWVLISFIVTTTGKVSYEKVLRSSLGPEYEKAALELVATFTFRPWVVDKKPRPFNNWVERVDFLAEGEAPSPSWPNPKNYFDIDCDV